MLNNLSRLTGSTVTATDGLIGHAGAAFFDDRSWTIRYLVVDTGSWLAGRKVLISPYSIKQPLGSARNIDVALTQKQVEGSPDIDTHQPVSRQHELETLNYYAYPEYWEGVGIWGMDAYPLLPALSPATANVEARDAKARNGGAAEVHLRSSTAVTGYEIHATDGSIGHVKDFVFDDESWSIRYLLVDTLNWWPGGRKVLVANHWIDRIDWGTSTVHVSLTREQVKSGPEYHEAQGIDRGYEQRLHEAYDRKGYWL